MGWWNKIIDESGLLIVVQFPIDFHFKTFINKWPTWLDVSSLFVAKFKAFQYTSDLLIKN